MALPTANAGAAQAFAFSSLPIASVTLSGSGTPGTGGSSITGYAWTIISQPPTASATLSDNSIAGPTFGPCTVQGDYVLFLRVTDNLGNQSSARSALTTSETAALTYVRVRSQYADMVIPGTGELDAGDYEYAWWVETDANTGRLDTLVVQDLTDVAEPTTTGPNLDFLTSGAYATLDGLAGGTAQHTHPVNTVDPCNQSDLGTVLVEDAPQDPAFPVAVNRDRVSITGLDVHSKVAPSATTGDSARSLCQTPPMTEGGYTLVSVGWNMADGGTTTRDDYVFSVHRQTLANYKTNTFGAALSSATITPPPTDNAPLAGVIRVADVALSADDVLSLKITGDADSADQGSRLSVTYNTERRV